MKFIVIRDSQIENGKAGTLQISAKNLPAYLQNAFHEQLSPNTAEQIQQWADGNEPAGSMLLASEPEFLIVKVDDNARLTRLSRMHTLQTNLSEPKDWEPKMAKKQKPRDDEDADDAEEEQRHRDDDDDMYGEDDDDDDPKTRRRKR